MFSFSLLFIIGKKNKKKVKRIFLLHTSLGCWKRSQGDGDVDRQGMNDDNSISNYSNGYKVNRSKWKMNDSSHLPRARFNSFPVYYDGRYDRLIKFCAPRCHVTDFDSLSVSH